MITDIFTLISKEWKEVLRFQSSSRSGMIGLFIIIAIFGIFMPIQSGRLWVETPLPLSLWFVIPTLLIGMMVADSFAGERERHTLETLLASRLPDRAILLGKMGAIVSYVWLITQLVFIVALVPVNILHGKGSLLLYSSEIVLLGMGLSLLLSALMSNIGILVSVRSATVRQAQQTLGLSIFILAWVVPLIGNFTFKFIPMEARNKMLHLIQGGDISGSGLIACMTLVIFNIVLFAVVAVRFHRTRLILD